MPTALYQQVKDSKAKSLSKELTKSEIFLYPAVTEAHSVDFGNIPKIDLDEKQEFAWEFFFHAHKNMDESTKELTDNTNQMSNFNSIQVLLKYESVQVSLKC